MRVPVRQSIMLNLCHIRCWSVKQLPKHCAYRNLQRHRAVIPAPARLSC